MTIGLSPKTILAFLYPLIASLVAAASTYVVTGDLNDAEIRTALVGLGASSLAALGAWVGQPGNVQATIDGPGSDELLPEQTITALERQPAAIAKDPQ